MQDRVPGVPKLGAEPLRHPACCASLSAPLLAAIASLLPKWSASITTSPLILSIGSGTGLLEELLHTYLLDNNNKNNDIAWRVEGVEVNPSVNVYLPEDRINHVPGTWATHPGRARDATVLLFVYPRDGLLIQRYVNEWMLAPDSKRSDGGKVKSKDSDRLSVGHGPAIADVGERRKLKRIIWLGPKADWEDTGLSCFENISAIEVLKIPDCSGIADYEMLGVLR
ncbi:hypothetical protein F5Y16DRAFT_177997 [Xylariaceae sp. FL0255]|nr:hypothetical protein F5Y16DRAFT_177997 [Xylariaceae sp. FL0255]